MLTILEGEASEERVDKELRHLVRPDWDFKVRKLDHQEYLTVFPYKNTLETFRLRDVPFWAERVHLQILNLHRLYSLA